MHFISCCLRCVCACKLFRGSKLEAIENGKGTSHSNSNQDFICTKDSLKKQNISLKHIDYLSKQFTYLPTLLTCWFALDIINKKMNKSKIIPPSYIQIAAKFPNIGLTFRKQYCKFIYVCVCTETDHNPSWKNYY